MKVERVLITKKINNFFIYSQFYYYNPDKTDYRIYWYTVQYHLLLFLLYLNLQFKVALLG